MLSRKLPNLNLIILKTPLRFYSILNSSAFASNGSSLDINQETIDIKSIKGSTLLYRILNTLSLFAIRFESVYFMSRELFIFGNRAIKAFQFSIENCKASLHKLFKSPRFFLVPYIEIIPKIE